jgi:hypothetical protein
MKESISVPCGVKNAARRLKKYGIPMHIEFRMVMAKARVEESL